MELQEKRMSKDEKDGGEDLDIFEGLGRKPSATSAAPPPSGSGQNVASAFGRMPVDGKRTLLGIPGPATHTNPARPKVTAKSASNAPSEGMGKSQQPPPPPGRAALPSVGDTSGLLAAAASTDPVPEDDATIANGRDGASARPSPVSIPPSGRPAIRKSVTPAPSGAPRAAATDEPKKAAPKPGIEMDWDDEEATHVFKEEERKQAIAGAAAGLGAASAAPPAGETGKTGETAKPATPAESAERLESPTAGSKEPERASMDAILAEAPRLSQTPTAAPLEASAPSPLAAIPPPAPAPQISTPPESGEAATIQVAAAKGSEATTAPPPAPGAAAKATSTPPTSSTKSTSTTTPPPVPGNAASPSKQPPANGSSSSKHPSTPSLAAAFEGLGKKPGAAASVPPLAPPPARTRSGAPGPQGRASATPPPGAVRNSTAPIPPPRPPPPPGQTTTAPMHMPERPSTGPTSRAPDSARPGAAMSPASRTASMPPVHPSQIPSRVSGPPSGHPSMAPSAPAVPYVPPAPRAMEATMRTRASNQTPFVVFSVIGAVAIVAGAVFFLLPKSATLAVNVSDAKGGVVSNLEVTVDGVKRCDSAPCIVNDVSAGIHEVKVAAKGFETPAPRAITLDGHNVQADFQLVAARSNTGIKASAPQSGVKLQVDGKEVGSLPLEVRDLEPGEHKLHFSGDRYQAIDKTVNVGKDELVDVGAVKLKVVKGKATFQLTTPGARVVLVNGTVRKEVPQFPMAIEFDPSETWELSATKDGFEEHKEKILFEDGQAERTFNIALTPKGGAAAAAPAAVPTTAAAPAAPTQPAAPAPAPVDPQSATPKAAPKDVKPAAETPAAAAANAETSLKINSLPASSVMLDGKPIGVTPLPHVPVTPGSHTIVFVNAEQSLKKTITVDVKAGESKAAFAKLRDESSVYAPPQ